MLGVRVEEDDLGQVAVEVREILHGLAAVLRTARVSEKSVDNVELVGIELVDYRHCSLDGQISPRATRKAKETMYDARSGIES